MSNQLTTDLGFFEEGGAADDTALIGRVIAERYRLDSELGRGGMGIVFLATDVESGGKVAVKMLSGGAAQSEQLRGRFRREAETASRLNHPGICGVHAFGDFEALPYIVMDYVEGDSLAHLLATSTLEVATEQATEPELPARELPTEDPHEAVTEPMMSRQRGSLPVEDMVRLIERTARALHAAHEEGLIHRDVKPGNVMVTPEGAPVLLDFGLARDVEAVGQTLTQSGQILGTPAYLAPEQIVGERARIDRRTDIYALGVTLYECLTLKRPFQGDTWDQLFHDILNGDSVPPRRLNPAIPPDLATVVGKAMDRDQHRRYATAEEFADDLRRVRRFQPVVARPPGPLLRARRWARRRPAKAALAGTALAVVLLGAGFLAWQGVSRVMTLNQKYEEAESALQRGAFTEALELVAQARDLDGDPTRAAELKGRIEAAQERASRDARRRADLETAAQAREEFQRKQAAYVHLVKRIRDQEKELEGERSAAFDRFAPDSVRGALARREDAIASEEIVAERLRQEARETLDRAARLESRWDGLSKETEAAYAALYMNRWREAVTAGERAEAVSFREAVLKHDRAGRYQDELLGRGKLIVGVDPPDAELHLFRYEDYASLRPGDPIPRLVPVPTNGVGKAREGAWTGGFHAGDPCLVVTSVEPGSVAATAGLKRGDLVIRLNGEPCSSNLFVRGVARIGDTPAPKIPLLSRLVSLNQQAIDGWYDWREALSAGDGEGDRIGIAGSEEGFAVSRRAVQLAPAWWLAASPPPIDMQLTCLQEGEAITLEVPAGKAAGLRCEVSTYPLIRTAENRITAGRALAVDPGSYLVVARRDGHETQRHPVFVPRGESVGMSMKLLERGTTPSGFVYVPPGPFRVGGDPKAVLSGPAKDAELEGFFIARFELTNAQWFEFVNDPKTLASIRESGERRFLPRDTTRLIARKDEKGPGYLHGVGSPRTPVLGISWHDAAAFLAWKNAKAEAAGEPWVYDLPTSQEWEKAARGADGRLFPWGDRFDHALTVGAHRKGSYLLGENGGFEPRDVSPFGVFDLGGSRQEWTRDAAATAAGAPPAYVLKGGAWSDANVDAFRAAARGYRDADFTGGNTGLRLVLRRRR